MHFAETTLRGEFDAAVSWTKLQPAFSVYPPWRVRNFGAGAGCCCPIVSESPAHSAINGSTATVFNLGDTVNLYSTARSLRATEVI